MSLPRCTMPDVVTLIKRDLRTPEQRLARTPSLRPSDALIMDAYVQGDPGAIAIVDAWRFHGHHVTIVDRLPD